MNISNKETKAVVNAGAVPPLVNMLSSQNDKIVQISLWTLTNIIGGGERLRDFVLSQGFLEPFLDLWKRDLPGDLKTILPWTLNRLFRFNNPPPPFLVARSVLPLVEQHLRLEVGSEVTTTDHRLLLFSA